MEQFLQVLTELLPFLQEPRGGIPLPVVYLIILIGAILWGGSLRERIFQLGAREAVGWSIWVWLVWLTIRLLRLTLLSGSAALARLLWYGIYPCLGLLAFLVVWSSYASNRTPEDRALPRWLQGLLLVDHLLAWLALT